MSDSLIFTDDDFQLAVKYVSSDVAKDQFETKVQLLLYSYYKQATTGDCSGSRPSLFQQVQRAKWYVDQVESDNDSHCFEADLTAI